MQVCFFTALILYSYKAQVLILDASDGLAWPIPLHRPLRTLPTISVSGFPLFLQLQTEHIKNAFSTNTPKIAHMYLHCKHNT